MWVMAQCEWEFFPEWRCTDVAVTTVTYGQFQGWTYKYCIRHRNMVMAQHDDAREDTDAEL